jgi:hypothetical protein
MICILLEKRDRRADGPRERRPRRPARLLERDGPEGNKGSSSWFRSEMQTGTLFRMKRGLLSLKLGNELFSAVDHLPIVNRSLESPVMLNLFV